MSTGPGEQRATHQIHLLPTDWSLLFVLDYFFLHVAAPITQTRAL
jgi:hypothetical protein